MVLKLLRCLALRDTMFLLQNAAYVTGSDVISLLSLEITLLIYVSVLCSSASSARQASLNVETHPSCLSFFEKSLIWCNLIEHGNE